MLIAELEYCAGNLFEGEYRIIEIDARETSGGRGYLAMRIADMSGVLKVYVWQDRCKGHPESVNQMDCVRLHGELRYFHDKWIADAVDLEVLTTPIDDPVRLLPADCCPLPNGLERLRTLVESITIEELRDFALVALSNDSLVLPFVKVPASLNHHHNEPDGLLAHSLECAEQLGSFSQFPQYVRELGIIAALFHDLGKTRTMTQDMTRTMTGYLLDHDVLTLELLSGPLTVLDMKWPDGGLALRYLLSWDKGRFELSAPLMTIAEAVRFADRCSAGLNMEGKLYDALPHAKQLLNPSVGTSFWRPRCPLSQLDRDKIARNGV
jgi:3'-5' exoribonuclease